MRNPSDILKNCIETQIALIHTCLPAIIISYDYQTNKAVVQPALNKAYLNTENGVPMPVINDVPVIFPKNITFPINEGDYVLLLFAERSIDLWLNVGGQVTPNDPRKYNLSDAIAIPNFLPFNSDFSENDGSSFKIDFAGSKIQIEDNGDVQIETSNKIAIGTQAIELLQQISDTLAGINDITITITSGSSAGVYGIDNTATFTAIKNNIDTLKGLIT